MNFNPFDLFNDFVIEHGSALVTEKHIALIKDQFMLAEKEITKLKLELKDMQAENNKLREIVQKYQKPNYDDILSEQEVNILRLLSKHDDRRQIRADHIAESLNLELQTTIFYLNELVEKKMILDHHIAGSEWAGTTSYSYWTLEQGGRRYLVEKKLIS